MLWVSVQRKKKFDLWAMHFFFFSYFRCPSLIHLLLLLKDVVTCKQPGDGDWKIFAASNERKEEADILYNVKQNLLKVLNAKDGIQEDEIPPMYYVRFFLKKMLCSLLRISKNFFFFFKSENVQRKTEFR